MLYLSLLEAHRDSELSFSLIYCMIQISVVKTALMEQRTRIPNRASLHLFDRNENSLCHSKPRSNAQANLTSSNKENCLHSGKKNQEKVFKGSMFLWLFEEHSE